MAIAPDDEHNRALVQRTHPPDWTQPSPADVYDLVVIGGGPGGLVAAMGASGVGARVALVESNLLGGDCLISGCVPSKALLKSAKVARQARRAASYGVSVGDVSVDFGAVMQRMRKLRAHISHHDSAKRFQEAGIDVFLGHGRFTSHDTVSVGDLSLRFKRAVIATGAHPRRPDLPGADQANLLSNIELFELTELPERFVVVGGGVIGCEMAQAFAAFGSRVTLLERAERILERLPADASAAIHKALVADGVTIVCDADVTGFGRTGDTSHVHVTVEEDDRTVDADAVLVSMGRVPNTRNLGLDAAGVKADGRGIDVDDFLCTANGRVYAIGDVASRYQFTHAADAMARMVIRNAFFFGRKRHSALVVPSCTYTQPEVATVGQTHAEGDDTMALRASGEDLDRTVVDGNEGAFVQMICDSKGGILGATAVGERAGELINTISVAMTAGTDLPSLADTIFAYPTESELIKRCADAYNRTRLSDTAASFLRTVISLRR